MGSGADSGEGGNSKDGEGGGEIGAGTSAISSPKEGGAMEGISGGATSASSSLEDGEGGAMGSGTDSGAGGKSKDGEGSRETGSGSSVTSSSLDVDAMGGSSREGASEISSFKEGEAGIMGSGAEGETGGRSKDGEAMGWGDSGSEILSIDRGA